MVPGTNILRSGKNVIASIEDLSLWRAAQSSNMESDFSFDEGSEGSCDY